MCRRNLKTVSMSQCYGDSTGHTDRSVLCAVSTTNKCAVLYN